METKNNSIPFEATHPGILIKDEIDARPELTQKELAKELGVKPSFLNEIIKGKRSLTADIAILLEKTLEIPADYWMKFQSQYEIDKARIKEKNIEKLRNIELWNIIKEYVPIKYFKKYGYLKNEIVYDIQKVKQIYAVNSIDELVGNFAQRKLSFFRKSEKLKIDERNMVAWSALAQFEAQNQKINTFNFENIPYLIKELNEVLYQNVNTLEEVKSLLSQFGIKFILIEKFEKTPIDGFSFWSDDNPAIAMTLRHKRVDNFAFTLMHEIGHIDLHLKNNKEKEFIDLSKNKRIDSFEKEADKFAQENLIAPKIWKDILENHIPLSEEKINWLGEQHHINPAILLGRACYEMDFYAIKTRINKSIG